MTLEEAHTVGVIACNADDGCSHCAAELIRMLQAKFPEHALTFGAAYLSQFEYTLDGEDD